MEIISTENALLHYNVEEGHSEEQIKTNKEKIKLQLYLISEIFDSSEYYSRIYTEKELEGKIDEFLDCLKKLTTRRIQPYQIIGYGYLSYYEYQLAKNYLLNSIASYKRAIKLINNKPNQK